MRAAPIVDVTGSRWQRPKVTPRCGPLLATLRFRCGGYVQRPSALEDQARISFLHALSDEIIADAVDGSPPLEPAFAAHSSFDIDGKDQVEFIMVKETKG